MKKSILKKVRQEYENGRNMMSFLNGDTKTNSVENIMISYDFQAGEYVDYYYNNIEEFKAKSKKVSRYIDSLPCNVESIFEAGVGEATMLVPILNNLKKKPIWVGGVDLSWSRIKTAQQFTKSELNRDSEIQLFVGDMFGLPLHDDAIDVVYTVHALEPNGGKEKELLQELYRVTRNYLILIEPSYELADKQGKERMEKNGYVKYLPKHCEDLGYKILLREPFLINNELLNPAEVLVIEKNANTDSYRGEYFCCPTTKENLKLYNGFWFSEESMLSYPIINGVSCLSIEDAIVTTKMMRYLNE